MRLSLYTPLYSITLLLSAALLFSIQPLFSKMVLPLLGGAPQVWNTAMLFFQVMLLGGYAYAHATTRYLSIRAQGILHCALLALFIVVLPVAIPAGWLPPVDQDPTLWQLSLMAVTVGGPFFVLAGSAPMLQRWFTSTDHPGAGDPYFLYGASNLGSMTALLAYPVLIEPALALKEQSMAWAVGYGGLLVLAVLCVASIWPLQAANKKKPRAAVPVTWKLRLTWMMLAFIPSSLMLGVTTYITTDVASAPLLWIIPLALYVGTFILAFAKSLPFKKEQVLFIQGVLMICLLAQIMQMSSLSPSIAVLICFHLVIFFFCALACHMELASLRPAPAHLTEFYLLMSAGGALGGFLNAIIAPQFFIIPLEYAGALALAAFMRYTTHSEALPRRMSFGAWLALAAALLCLVAFMIDGAQNPLARGALTFGVALCLSFVVETRWLFAIAFSVCLAFFPPGHYWAKHYAKEILHQDRSFFGVLRVIDTNDGERLLLHGTTNHGTQALDEKLKGEAFSYYGGTSPLRDAMKYLDAKAGPQKAAVLGLGIGVASCWQKPGRHFEFFEIDPDVVAIAENIEYFTFLSDCGSPYDITLGDARLTLTEKDDEYYDFIMVDVFSSDNIPVHLMTQEAIRMYLSKLRDDGVLVFHISNNHLDLEPVLAEIAKSLDTTGLAHVSNGGDAEGTKLTYYPAHAFIFARSEKQKLFFEKLGWSEAFEREGVKLWTDQYSNIVGVLGNEAGLGRMKALAEKEKAEKEKTEKEKP